MKVNDIVTPKMTFTRYIMAYMYLNPGACGDIIASDSSTHILNMYLLYFYLLHAEVANAYRFGKLNTV